MGFFDRISEGLSRSRQKFTEQMNVLLDRGPNLDDDFWDDLEETLILADMGGSAASQVVENLRDEATRKALPDAYAVLDRLNDELASTFATTEADPAIVLDSATGRHYGSGSNWGMTLRGEADGMEYEIMLDLYDDESVDAGFVTEGVYTVSADGSDGTISPDYSSVDILDTADYSNYHYTLSSGTLEVKIADGEYALRLDVVLNDGSSLVVVYNGPVEGIEIAA